VGSRPPRLAASGDALARVIESGARGEFTFRALEQLGPDEDLVEVAVERTIEDVEAVVTRVVRRRAHAAGEVQWVRRHSAR